MKRPHLGYRQACGATDGGRTAAGSTAALALGSGFVADHSTGSPPALTTASRRRSSANGTNRCRLHNLQQALRVSDKTGFLYVDTSEGGRTGYLVEFGDSRQIFESP